MLTFLWVSLRIMAWLSLWASPSQDVAIQHLSGPGLFDAPRPEKKVEVKVRLSVKVAADGTIRFEGEEVTKDQLHEKLVERLAREPATGLSVESHRDTPIDHFLDVLDTADRAGIPLRAVEARVAPADGDPAPAPGD